MFNHDDPTTGRYNSGKKSTVMRSELISTNLHSTNNNVPKDGFLSIT